MRRGWWILLFMVTGMSGFADEAGLRGRLADRPLLIAQRGLGGEVKRQEGGKLAGCFRGELPRIESGCLGQGGCKGVAFECTAENNMQDDRLQRLCGTSGVVVDSVRSLPQGVRLEKEKEMEPFRIEAGCCGQETPSHLRGCRGKSGICEFK